MLKLTKTGIGLLTKQYRSVLRKCLLLNLGLFMTTTFLNLTIPNTVEANGVEIGGGSAPHSLAVAIGPSVSAGGDYAIGIGNSTVASMRDAIAIGGSAYISGNNSVALGSWSTVTGYYSVALGSDSIANEDYVISVGHKSTDSMWNGSVLGEDLFRRIVNVAAGQNDNDVVILKQLNDSLNYYYTFRVDERDEVIDSASFFQKYFSTLQKVDLQSKNLTHLGAFTKCDEVCPRPSERFSLSLSQEQMLKNDASVDAGTSRHCLRQFGDVVADLLKNTAAKGLRIYEFMNEEVRHA